MDVGTCVSDLARYIEFPREEEERPVEHAKRLTAAVVMAHATSEARNQEIYKQSDRFERDRLERQWAFELASVAEHAAAADIVLHLYSSPASSSSASYLACSVEERLPEVAQSHSVVVFRGLFCSVHLTIDVWWNYTTYFKLASIYS